MIMNCIWYGQRLSLDSKCVSRLSPDQLDTLEHGTNEQYINILAELALAPGFTKLLFKTHEPLFVEFCSRWLVQLAHGLSPLKIVSAIARILPMAAGFGIFVEEIACRQRQKEFTQLFSKDTTSLLNLPEATTVELLVTVMRLLNFDSHAFACLVPAAQLQVLLRNGSACVKYLSARILCMYVHASDSVFLSMVDSFIGGGPVTGPWEDKTIDYRCLGLWETTLLDELREDKHMPGDTQNSDSPSIAECRILTSEDLSRNTVALAGHLVPSLGLQHAISSAGHQREILVHTDTTQANLRKVAKSLCDWRPVLISGLAGSGKSLLIRYAAQRLEKISTLTTLHLNEQTDAKSLIGLYTSGPEPGSFSWQAGVLTTAVKEGRWVIIEDLDRAPSEVISILLPLIERRELLVPNAGGWIRASRDFKLFATLRSFVNARAEEVIPGLSMLGIRHWNCVNLNMLSDQDLQDIVRARYPSLRQLESVLFRTYHVLKYGKHEHVTQENGARISQNIGTQELLRLCSRLETLQQGAGLLQAGAIPDIVHDYMFLEAIDCFSAAANGEQVRSAIAAVIAEEFQISWERMHHLLNCRIPTYHFGTKVLKIGRASLRKENYIDKNRAGGSKEEKQTFALTPQALRNMESIGMAVRMREPCLLVGETGIGKTAIIQELASLLHHSLTVVNLSQQSEASDLIGGFKPLNARSLVIPVKDDFEILFRKTFPSGNNDRFLKSIDRAIAKSAWTRALGLWREVFNKVHSTLATLGLREENSKKRRKLENQKYQALEGDWQDFMGRLDILEGQLEAGENGFAFSFVEGSIVKAVKSGSWLLLDEINLASSDTLESLAELFSNQTGDAPSILLSESGTMQKLDAHPNFRVFGSMNPATDVGKRDLPPGIRSRFTEFYIRSPEEDPASLLQIITAHLRDQVHNDIAAPQAIANLYLEIRKLEAENRLADGAEQKPHFSIRTLTRALTYATDVAHLYGLRRALLEGFSMAFLTVLNKDSCSIISLLFENHLLGTDANRRALLKRIPKTPANDDRYVKFRQYWMPRGSLPVQQQPHYIITPFVEANLLNLVRAASSRRYPVLLQGPTSSGKTSMVEYLAKISGNKFVRINNHEHTDLQEYLGTYIAGAEGLYYEEGILVQALREGHWVVLDELNLAPTDILEALNRLLDDNRELLIPETQEIVKPHPNFMLFATQNPPGIYGGRKMLSRAFRNRFLELHFDDIPENELETILIERSQIAPSFCSRIVAVYKKLSVLRQSDRVFEHKNSFATLRDLFRWALRKADDREQLAINGFMLLAERVRSAEERSVVKSVIEDVMKVKIDEDALYGVDALQSISNQKGSSDSNSIVWTRAARRLFVLVHQALCNHEPVLLVGPTGCGKTSICQEIADSAGYKLSIVNAHQNTETGDLIGSQRPLRNRSQLEGQLREDLVSTLKAVDFLFGQESPGLSFMIEAYQRLNPDQLRQVPQNLIDKVNKNLWRSKALFEWSDGSLVRAMKDGDYFLLDEISLADDSVLERLNSVLEPGRSLLLAEKGSTGITVSASENFQFLATMNPGGDYGKKELSPALRNRFTEIWVPPLSESEDILAIVQNKLKTSMAHFAEYMVDFAMWFSATFTNFESNISIRDLLAWAQFTNISTGESYDSIFHGAALVYIDKLGANPSGRMSSTEETLRSNRQSCLEALSRIFQHDFTQFNQSTPELSVDKTHLKSGDLSIPRRNIDTYGINFSLQAPTTKSNAVKLLRALQLDKPVLLEGNPGVGKTTLISVLAKVIGMPLTRMNLSDQTDLMDLFGSDVPVEGGTAGRFEWRDAPFLKAMQQGEWVLLDEMNLASQSILEGLNACLDHRGEVYIPELERTFQKHPDFVVFAAQNPHSQGGGRKGLPASFVNRFTVIYADMLTTDDFLLICSQLFPNVSSSQVSQLVSFVLSLADVVSLGGSSFMSGGPWEFNLRDILRWLSLLQSDSLHLAGASPSDFVDVLFFNRFRAISDVADLKRRLNFPISARNPFHTYYQKLSPFWYQCGFGVLPRSKFSLDLVQSQRIWRPDLLESLMICVEESWPCLLVGPSGSGKTHLVHYLSSIVGADTVELPLSPDTDTVDIVGGYEQVDMQRKLLSFMRKLRGKMQAVIANDIEMLKDTSLPLQILACLTENEDVDTSMILSLLEALQDTELGGMSSSLLEECQSLTRQLHEDVRAQFVWVDGILIEALEHGQWLILDNANLCNSSVLDRLNALLEPDGVLSVNEHRSADGSPKVVTPHPRFRIFLTMDPRNGELSRAMRNRCIEIYLSKGNDSTPSAHPIMKESMLARFRIFNHFNWDSLDPTSCSALLKVCFENLLYSDYHVLETWIMQVGNGLLSFNPQSMMQYHSVAEAFYYVMREGSEIRRLMVNYYNSSFPDHDFSESKSETPLAQPMHPLVNAPLLSHSPWTMSWNHGFWLAEAFEIRIDLLVLRSMLSRLAESLNESVQPQLTRLERSILSKQHLIYARDSTQALENFLCSFLDSMGAWLDAAVTRILGRDALRIVHTFAALPEQIFDIATVAEFKEVAFQACLDHARSVADSALRNNETKDLGGILVKHLAMFNSKWKLSTGGSMELLWNHFRPVTAKSADQLRTVLDLEKLSEKFDSVLWKSGAALDKLADYRESFISAYRHTESSFLATDLKGLREVLVDEENAMEFSSAANRPFFSNEFEGIRQYFEFFPQGPGWKQKLEILSGRKTWQAMKIKASALPASWLLGLQHLTGIDDQKNWLAPVRQHLAVTTLQKLCSTSEVDIGSLEMFDQEFNLLGASIVVLTKHITEDYMMLLNMILGRLHLAINSLYQGRHDSPSMFEYGILIQKLLSSSPSSLISSISLNHAVPTTFDGGQFREVLDTYLLPSLRLLIEYNSGKSHGFLLSAEAWTYFFTGILLLYVPDRAFDPAYSATLSNDRRARTLKTLKAKLSALEQYERVSTGQRSNLRYELLEKRLSEFAEQQEAPTVLRPEAGDVNIFQGEYLSILNSVITKMVSSHIVSTNGEPYRHQISTLLLIKQNIKQVSSQLLQQPREYDDILQPVLSMLQGLEVGLSMHLIADAEYQQVNLTNGNNKQSLVSKPILGLKWESISRLLPSLKDHVHGSFLCEQWLSFQKINLQKIARRSLPRPAVFEIHAIFQSCYEKWNAELSKSQERHALQNSLYRFRGSEDHVQEDEQREFQEIFPDYEGSTEHQASSASKSAPSFVQVLIRAVSEFHLNLFATEQQLGDELVKFVTDLTSRLASEVKLSDNDYSAVPPREMIAGLLLKLDEVRQQMSKHPSAGKGYNFYTDPNLDEMRNLTQILRQIDKKFRALKKSWPEHATVDDVLRTLTILFETSHTEPVAKVLMKTEKLHSYVYEWQSVTSREFTAAQEYDTLTTLIINWRRLELSTWAKLLDMETEKCLSDTNLWWFIAYNMIIHSSMAIHHDGALVPDHIKGMLSELRQFLLTTPLGQYASRLQLIERFSEHALLLAEIAPSMELVHSALRSFVRFYSRYNVLLNERLRSGREKCEKELKEIVLLASWKDTNITALRESAKRSHHKLFNVVRKYRALLNSPVEGLITIEAPIPQVSIVKSSVVVVDKVQNIVDQSLLTQCKTQVPGWTHLPSRFKDAGSTAARMILHARLPVDSYDGCASIDSFSESLAERVKILQKETPKSLTEENKQLVQHLKSRKRKLFAETLKEMRLMGFRSNIDTGTLNSQTDISSVLAVLKLDKNSSESEAHLFSVLDNITIIRSSSKKQSDELTTNEVSRSLAYLESILETVLRQRSYITTHLQGLDKFKHELINLTSLWAPQKYDLQISTNREDANELRNRLNWLQALIFASCIVLERHDAFGGDDTSPLRRKLEEWSGKFANAEEGLSASPPLPEGLSTTLERQQCENIKLGLSDFQGFVEQQESEYPMAAFLLSSLIPWTDQKGHSFEPFANDSVTHLSGESVENIESIREVSPDEEAPKSHGSRLSLELSIASFAKVADEILIATQALNKAQEGLLASGDETAWLVKTCSSLHNALESFRIAEINESLKKALSDLSGYGNKDLTVLAAFSAAIRPIFLQYQASFSESLNRYFQLHSSLCNMAYILSQTLKQLVLHGFCSPQEKSNQKQDSEKLEDGTGLGEGEGAEDISKDVEDDEDLSELAQEKKEGEKEEELENEEDAVNMNESQLEGAMDDEADTHDQDQDEKDDESRDGEDDVDDEVDSVSGSDQSVIDEKLWDGDADEGQKEKAHDGNQGKPDDDLASGENPPEKEYQNKESDEIDEIGADETENVPELEKDEMDTNVQSGENLELPEDMEFENQNEEASEGEDLEDLSDSSDIESTKSESPEDTMDETADGIPHPQDFDSEVPEDEEMRNEDAGSVAATDPEPEDHAMDNGLLQEHSKDIGDPERQTQSEGHGIDRNNQQEDTKDQGASATGNGGLEQDSPPAEDLGQEMTSGTNGALGNAASAPANADGKKDVEPVSAEDQPLRKLGDVLEKWHRINQEIQNVSEELTEPVADHEKTIGDQPGQDFEHVRNDSEADDQVLAPADDEQKQAVDQQALDAGDLPDNEDVAQHIDEQPVQDHEAIGDWLQDDNDDHIEDNAPPTSTVVIDSKDWQKTTKREDDLIHDDHEDVDDLDNELSTIRLDPAELLNNRSMDEAQQLWLHFEAVTREFSLHLTEQLRLVLAPTLASKMRGDFRTGKRLNIKRIIPYIASHFKRDKIWMRRSIPSKRDYQIMLAVDDSKSMNESGSGKLAFETLALVSKSLSMLEVGQVSIIGFGDTVRVAHPFDQTFSSEAGARVLQNITFQQTKTNVRLLLSESLVLFRQARALSYNSRASDTWQLQLIISDGICEDHGSIRRLVRQAHEERVMILFVIVDALNGEGKSITEMTEATFEKDEHGNIKPRIKRYLEGFPFGYYLIVHNITELPNLLSLALRQWFAEVVESG